MAVLEKRRALGFAACAVASCFWGCGFFFGKIALDEMNSAFMVLYRFLFTMPVLLPFLITHRPGLNRQEWGWLALAAFLGVPLQFLIQFYALSITTVSHAALMVGTMPVILAVGAAVWAHERMDRVGWMALTGSTCGAALIALGGGKQTKGGATLAGDLLVVVSLLIALFLDLDQQKTSGAALACGGDGVWVGDRDADADCVGSGEVWDASGDGSFDEGMAGAGGERGVVYGDDDSAVELGNDAGSGFAGGSVVEYGAADWKPAWCAGAG